MSAGASYRDAIVVGKFEPHSGCRTHPFARPPHLTSASPTSVKLGRPLADAPRRSRWPLQASKARLAPRQTHDIPSLFGALWRASVFAAGRGNEPSPPVKTPLARSLLCVGDPTTPPTSEELPEMTRNTAKAWQQQPQSDGVGRHEAQTARRSGTRTRRRGAADGQRHLTTTTSSAARIRTLGNNGLYKTRAVKPAIQGGFDYAFASRALRGQLELQRQLAGRHTSSATSTAATSSRAARSLGRGGADLHLPGQQQRQHTEIYGVAPTRTKPSAPSVSTRTRVERLLRLRRQPCRFRLKGSRHAT